MFPVEFMAGVSKMLHFSGVRGREKKILEGNFLTQLFGNCWKFNIFNYEYFCTASSREGKNVFEQI